MKNDNINYNLLEERETNIDSSNKNTFSQNEGTSNSNKECNSNENRLNSNQKKIRNTNSLMLINQEEDESFDGNNQENFSRKFVSKSKEEDLKYYRSIYYLPMFSHSVLIALLFLIPLFPIYFIQIKNKFDEKLNIKLSYFYVRYDHQLYSYYDCFNDCYETPPVTKCQMDIVKILTDYVANCNDYNNAKSIFLSVSKLFYFKSYI